MKTSKSKRLLSLFMALAMVLSLGTINAFAAPSTGEGETDVPTETGDMTFSLSLQGDKTREVHVGDIISVDVLIDDFDGKKLTTAQMNFTIKDENEYLQLVSIIAYGGEDPAGDSMTRIPCQVNADDGSIAGGNARPVACKNQFARLDYKVLKVPGKGEEIPITIKCIGVETVKNSDTANNIIMDYTEAVKSNFQPLEFVITGTPGLKMTVANPTLNIEEYEAKTSITVNKGDATLAPKDYTVELTPAEGMDDYLTAEYDGNGNIVFTALQYSDKEFEVGITAIAGEDKATGSVKVTIAPMNPTLTVELPENKVQLTKVGMTETVEAELTGRSKDVEKGLTWKSADVTVATVKAAEGNSLSAVVTAVTDEGNTTIEVASAAYPEVKHVFDVKILKGAPFIFTITPKDAVDEGKNFKFVVKDADGNVIDVEEVTSSVADSTIQDVYKYRLQASGDAAEDAIATYSYTAESDGYFNATGNVTVTKEMVEKQEDSKVSVQMNRIPEQGEDGEPTPDDKPTEVDPNPTPITDDMIEKEKEKINQAIDKFENTTKTDETTGTVTVETRDPSTGATGVTKTDKDGKVTAEANIPTSAATKATSMDKAIVLPITKVNVTEVGVATTITIKTNNKNDTWVAIPLDMGMKNTSYGTIIKVLNKDGTYTIIRNAIAKAGAIRAALANGAQVEIVDAAVKYPDVQADVHGQWAQDAIDFVSSRELFRGMGTNADNEELFVPDATMGRGMMMTVLGRFVGQDFTGDGYEERAAKWAKDKGIISGDNDRAKENISRVEMTEMLYNMAKKPEMKDDEVKTTLAAFPDASGITGNYAKTMAWSIKNKIIGGADGKLLADNSAKRSEVAAVVLRYCLNVNIIPD